MELDEQLRVTREELENIETKFPMEVSELKEQIEFAKQQTQEYDRKTIELKNELDSLRAHKK